LGQVFSKFGESVTLEALLVQVNQQLQAQQQVENQKTSFSNKEVDDCLAELTERGRVMVSDGEIYKI
jgi:glycerol-3-phosphate O-acyltransferase